MTHQHALADLTATSSGLRPHPTPATLGSVARLVTVVTTAMTYALTVLWLWHDDRTSGAVVVDPPALLVVAGYAVVLSLPVVVGLAAVGSARAMARTDLRGRPMLDAAVIALAVLAVATYVSPWGIAAARALLAD